MPMSSVKRTGKLKCVIGSGLFGVLKPVEEAEDYTFPHPLNIL